jgi:predicted phage terminase large subunit-like protein
LGKFPEKKIIQTAHTAELAVGFGRKVRNLENTPEYQFVFPTKLSTDSKAAGRWNTSAGGDYFAIGVGGAVTGKGADLLIIDDPHSEQEAMQGTAGVYDRVFEWYNSGPRQRLQPGGSIVIVMTRWSKKDLTGQILQNEANRGGDPWELIEFPAIMPSGKPTWPQFWKKEELENIKAELPVSKWEAQYQQNPTSEEGAIIKREMWKIWEKDSPPACEYIIQSWDTAFEKNNRADYSACTTWGIFRSETQNGEYINNIILLEAIKERMEFPELKARAFEQYKTWNPDTLIVEKKASGAPLIYEMRQMGIPISEYTPSKGSDKIARVNAISDLFASGLVWCPETRWADEVIEQCASFPNGDHDDLVDSTSQALLRFRQGGFLRLQTDEPDEIKPFKRKVEYY